MYIRIPGTTVEGDNAWDATSHPTLEHALEGVEKLHEYDSWVILGTDTEPLAVVAYAAVHRTRAGAQQAAAAVKEGTSELVAATTGATIVVWREA